MYFDTIDIENIEIGPEEVGNSGNKYRKVSLNGQQFQNVQLGSSLQDLIRCPFGAEPVTPDQPEKLCMKIDANDKLTNFISKLDKKVIDAVNDPSLVHRSTLRTGGVSNNMKVRLLPDTQVLTTTLKGENSMSTPKAGTIHDIVPNSMILPIVKIQGGVYFIEQNYGTSIAATHILVVQNASQKTSSFSLGDDVVICDD